MGGLLLPHCRDIVATKAAPQARCFFDFPPFPALRRRSFASLRSALGGLPWVSPSRPQLWLRHAGVKQKQYSDGETRSKKCKKAAGRIGKLRGNIRPAAAARIRLIDEGALGREPAHSS